MDWSDSWRGAFRIELRAQAIGLAYRGWPVMPGTYPAGTEWAGGATRHSDGPTPVHEDWANRLGASAEQIGEWWNGEPFSLLVATGTALNAIEVGTELGRRTAAALRAAGQPAPIAATPHGRWLFLTEAGDPAALPSELHHDQDVVIHGAGSWIPLPPTAFLHGIVHWRVRPEVCGWELPTPHVVGAAMARALADLSDPAALDRPLVGADRAFA